MLMCALSQFEISDAARMAHPAGRGHKIVAVLKFMFDESYDKRFMCVGGFIGEEIEWKRLEAQWQRRIDFENRNNRPDQGIERFHASRLNGGTYEFAAWTKEMGIKFSKKLIATLAKRRMGLIAVAADMDAIREVFPKGEENPFEGTYSLCIKQMMLEILIIVKEFFPGDKVLLIHDHGNWDEQALRAYNTMISTPKYRDMFVGLLPLTGNESVGLQAADLAAYETFKKAQAHESLSSIMRGSAKEMTKKQIPARAIYHNTSTIKYLHEVLAETGKYPDLDERGVC